MDELNAKQLQQQLTHKFYAKDKVRWAPIRHHSPACSIYLLELLDAFNPEHILIEAPSNYQVHIEAIADAQTKPPVAIYQEGSFFPLAENSPEYQAIKWASQSQTEINFIDLPYNSAHSETNSWDESWLNGSNYSKALQQKYECRDSDELWCRLFEQREFRSANDFFLQVLIFCAANRACYSEGYLARHGDLSRERYMRAQISKALKNDKRVLVLTGGFHTPALFDLDGEYVEQQPNELSYLVRYSEPQLDSILGYQAGMPYPSLVKDWFLMRRQNLDHQAVLMNMLERSCLAEVSIADKIKVSEHLQGLLALRRLNQPSYYDLTDSISSCWLQGRQSDIDFAQIQAAWRGTAVGDLSHTESQPPLIENVRQLATKHRLLLDCSEEKQARFDVFQCSDSARTRRQFLFGCNFLNLHFCHRLVGPSFSNGMDLSRQHEIWRYQWSSHVEVALLAASSLSDQFEQVVKQSLLAQADTNEFGTLIEWVANTIQCGFSDLVRDNLLSFQNKLAEQTSLKLLVQSMCHVISLANHPLFQTEQDLLTKISELLWLRVCENLAQLNRLEQAESVDILLSIQGFAVRYQSQFECVWEDQLKVLLKTRIHKTWLYFAIRALLANTKEKIAELEIDLTLQFSRDPQSAFDAIQVIVTLFPHWLNQQPVILNLLNTWLGQLSDQQFQLLLPSLRKLFCRLDSGEIDRIAASVREVNQWGTHLNWQPAGVERQSVERALELQKKMVETLKDKGLSSWLMS